MYILYHLGILYVVKLTITFLFYSRTYLYVEKCSSVTLPDGDLEPLHFSKTRCSC